MATDTAVAVDTNVVVRLLTRDDASQFAAARRVFETNSVHIPLTVWLECEWVLRHAYGFSPAAVAGAFMRILGLSQVETSSRDALVEAIVALEAGLDFADALHLNLAPADRPFVTFDQRLANRGTAAGRVVRLPT